MLTIEQIKAQIAALGKDVDTFGTKKEIRYLPQILQDSEEIKGLTSGLLNGNTWLIVCTTKRIIFLDKGMLWGLKQIETPLDKINSVECSTGIMFGEVAIWDGSSRVLIKNVYKKSVKPFVNAINTEIDKLRRSNDSKVDTADQISKLAELKKQGILTEEEFQSQKRKLLAA